MAEEDKFAAPPEWSNAHDAKPAFSVSRFQPELQNTYIPATDYYADQKGMHISFMHVPSNSVVSFKAFITAYNENFISNWTQEEVYGRADPIYMFKNTTRKITLTFKIPAASQSEAFENLGRVQKLVQFLYPRYTTVDGNVFAQTISQSPLVRMKVLNLGQSHVHGEVRPTEGSEVKATVGSLDPSNPGHAAAVKSEGFAAAAAGAVSVGPFLPSYTYKTMTDKTVSGIQSPNFGLLGIIENLTVNHNLEGEDGAFEEGPGKILPKLIDVQISFAAIHEHVVGWEDDPSLAEGSRFAVGAFPYSVDMEGSLPTPQAAATTDDVGPSDAPGSPEGNFSPPGAAETGAEEEPGTNQALLEQEGVLVEDLGIVGTFA